ncbi:MAG: helix-turn-helix transcriptional regulator [Oscillospiraceae bacterium]|nr:helix-turn-helix transcriptional regulator [Oscillospiraceae bacterium]
MDHWNSINLMNNIELHTCALSNVEISSPDQWRMLNYKIPFNKLYFVEEGTLKIELLDHSGEIEKVWLLEAGNVYLIPGGNTYNFRTDNSFKKLYMHFNMIMDDGYDMFHGVRQVLTLPFNSSEFRARQQKTESDPLILALYAKSLIYQLAMQFVEHSSKEIYERLTTVSHYPSELKNVIRMIRTSVNERVPIGDIARKNGLSASALTQLFKEYVGITPKKYVDELIYANACNLLLGTNASVKEIAADLHFANPYAFSKFFKTHSGLSPQMYRQSHQIPIKR